MHSKLIYFFRTLYNPANSIPDKIQGLVPDYYCGRRLVILNTADTISGPYCWGSLVKDHLISRGASRGVCMQT